MNTAQRKLRADALRLARDAGYRSYDRGFMPGKFEAEPFYITYFYEAAGDGTGEPVYNGETHEADLLEVTDDERQAFELNDDTAAVAVTYSEQGFIGLRELTVAEQAEVLSVCDEAP